MSSKIYLLLLFILPFATHQAISCSCDTISFESAREYADEIFVGRIVKAEMWKAGNHLQYDDYINGWDYSFKVKKKWKGSSKSLVIVSQLGTSCDFQFEINKGDYLVYAQKSEKNFTTHLCSRTIYFDYFNKDENWLVKDTLQLNKKFELVQLDDSQQYFLQLLGISIFTIGIISLLFYKYRTTN